jgi:hypothetical protein
MSIPARQAKPGDHVIHPLTGQKVIITDVEHFPDAEVTDPVQSGERSINVAASGTLEPWPISS